jgi:hypothetical protein
MPKLINDDVWFHNMEVDNYLRDPRNAIAHLSMADQADLLADIGEQLRTDEEVEDDFFDALLFDHFNGEPEALSYEDLSETADLCALVEAVEKGHIIYG